MYDWRWYANLPGHPVQQFNIAIARACARGVMVRAVVNLAEIVPVLKKVGVHARTLNDNRTLHAKLIIIDSETLVIGSHNFTKNAFSSNIEASLVVKIPSDERRFSIFFENLFNI